MLTLDATTLCNTRCFGGSTLCPMHPSVERLYLAARKLKGIQRPADVARLLNESPQTVKNWESRGVSHKGAIRASAALGITSAWLMDGAPVFMTAAQAAVLGETYTEGYAATALSAEEKPSASYRGSVAHAMSLPPFDTPPEITWGEAMSTSSLPSSFVLELPDDALNGHFEKGTRVVFSTNASPKVGKPILIEDLQGSRWIRLYGNVRGDRWQAIATGLGYVTLDSHNDGLTVLAAAAWIEA